MKRKIACIGFSFVSGISAASIFWGKYVINIMLIAMVLLIVIFFLLCKYRIYVTVIAASFCIGVLYLTVYTYCTYNKIVCYDDKTITFVGEVEEYEYLHSDFGRLTLKGKINNDVSTRITFFVSDDTYEYYDIVEVKAKVKKIDDNINFSAEGYNRPKGEYLKGVSGGQAKIIRKNTDPLLRAVKNFRDHICSVIDHYVDGDESAFLKAILCGDKTQMSSYTRTNLYRAGIGHILAVSGTHLSIITMFTGALLSMVIKNRKVKFVILQVFVWSFAVFAGLSPSVIRAAIMLTAVQLSDVLLKVCDTMNTLGWCVLIMTIMNPYIVRDPSFVLSLAGAISMGVIVPAVFDRIKQKGFKGMVIKNCVLVLAPMFTSVPVLLIFFDEISLIAPVANLLLLPLCTLSLQISSIVLITGGVSFIAGPILKIAGWIIHGVISCAEKISSFDYSYVDISTMKMKIIVGVVCLLWLVFVLKIKKPRYFIGSVIIAYSLIISMYNFTKIPDAQIYHLVFMPCEKTSQVLVYKNYTGVILDLGAKGENNSAIRNLMIKRGIRSIQSVLIMNQCYYTGYQYLGLFYPKQVELYGDFFEQTEIYKKQTVIPFENIVFYRNDNGYEAKINSDILETFRDSFSLNGEKYDLKEEAFPVEVVINNGEIEVWRLDYGFVKQCRLG